MKKIILIMLLMAQPVLASEFLFITDGWGTEYKLKKSEVTSVTCTQGGFLTSPSVNLVGHRGRDTVGAFLDYRTNNDMERACHTVKTWWKGK